MPDLLAVANNRFFLGGAAPGGNFAMTEASFSTAVWQEVGGWETKGETGITADEMKISLISSGYVQKQKGPFDAGSMENAFSWIPADLGQIAMIAAAQLRTDQFVKFHFSDTPAVRSSVFTVTIAAPGVVTWTAHGLANGAAVTLTTTGALPTGLAIATTYFVVAATANTFSLALTKGGASITTSGTQSGIHTVTTVPSPSIRYFTGKVMGATFPGGGASDFEMLNSSIAINSNFVDIAALG